MNRIFWSRTVIKSVAIAITAAITLAAIGYSQLPKASSKIGNGRPKYATAIEIIATVPDENEVQEAAEYLRSGGIESIAVLANHLGDTRVPPAAGRIARAVTGPVTVGTHCFWIIQDQLEEPLPKSERYSVLEPDTLKDWLDARAGMSIDELRREACIGAIQEIQEQQKAVSGRDYSKVLKTYNARLVELEKVIVEKKRSEKKSTLAK